MVRLRHLIPYSRARETNAAIEKTTSQSIVPSGTFEFDVCKQTCRQRECKRQIRSTGRSEQPVEHEIFLWRLFWRLAWGQGLFLPFHLGIGRQFQIVLAPTPAQRERSNHQAAQHDAPERRGRMLSCCSRSDHLADHCLLSHRASYPFPSYRRGQGLHPKMRPNQPPHLTVCVSLAPYRGVSASFWPCAGHLPAPCRRSLCGSPRIFPPPER